MGLFSDLIATWEQAKTEISYEPNDAEHVVRRVIDRPGLDGFQWRVWLVAGSGFFTTSYSIFSSNVISPALAYIYPRCDSNQSLIFNLTTLGGIIVGMVGFGFLADRYGRKSVYGAELVVVIVATVLMTTATEGRGGYMDIYGWIGAWRFLLGIGLGAEYPLSAIISAEWSSTRSRAKMMAAVFLMQSIGQLAAYALGLAILVLVKNNFKMDPNELDPAIAGPIIDRFWRIAIGIGAFPALIAIGIRRIIPETPLWLAVNRHVGDAHQAAVTVYPHDHDDDQDRQPDIDDFHATTHHRPSYGTDDSEDQTLTKRVISYLVGVRKYLAKNDRWRALLGVCIVWFLVDVAFYGLGLDSPRTISTIWLSGNATLAAPTDCTSQWRTDSAQPNISIYNALQENTVRNMVTISTGAVTGSVIILLAIDYIPRVTWMACWFVALGALFLVNGASFLVAFESDKYALTIAFYVLSQVMFNLGPNTITFIIPAELFDTRYRGTFYGIAAAAGKLGAVMIQVIISLLVVNRTQWQFFGLLVGMCPAMLLGAFVTWVWVPEVQYPRGKNEVDEVEDVESGDEEDGGRPVQTTFRQRLKLPNIPLEEIARHPSKGQIIGVRKNLARAGKAVARQMGWTGRERLKRKGRSRGSEEGEEMTEQRRSLRPQSRLSDGDREDVAR